MKYRYFYILLLLLILFNIVLLNFPLTNILGYESAVLNSIVVTLFSGLFSVNMLKRLPGRNAPDLKILVRQLIEANILFLAVPLLTGLTASLFIKNCSLPAGILYFLIITAPAVIVGTALGMTAYLISPRLPKLIFLLLYIIILSLPLYELYFYPQIYFYNPVLAYLPGTIYDEAVAVDLKLIVYRFLNVIFFLSCIILIIRFLYKPSAYPGRVVLLVSALMVSLLFFFFSYKLGYATTPGRMKEELNKRIITQHFEICLDESIDSSSARLIALHHEYYFREIGSYLRTVPRSRTLSFIFRNSAQKKTLLGTANADMAKPWLGTIFVNYENYDQTLKHEIVHSLSAELGSTIFKLGGFLNPALTEGIASAADNEYDGYTMHYMSALAYRNDYKIKIENLFTGLSFFAQVSGLSYIYTGSFCRFLIDNYGIEKFKKWYSGSEFSEIYSKSIPAAASEYYKFLENYRDTGTKAMADYYFGRAPIFKKVCARYAAEELGSGWRKFTQGRYKEAEIIFSNLFRLTNSYPAFSGYVNSLMMAGKDNDAFNLIIGHSDKYINTAYYFNTRIMLADAAAKTGRLQFADSLYTSVITEKPSRELYWLASLRKVLIKDSALIRNYLSGSNADKFQILNKMNDQAIEYLTIPVLINLSEDHRGEFSRFLKLAGRFVVSDSASSYAAYIMALYAERHGDFETALSLGEKSVSYPGLNNEIMLSDINRIRWLRNNSGLLNISERKN